MLSVLRKWPQTDKSNDQWSDDKKQISNKHTWSSVWLETELTASSGSNINKGKENFTCNQDQVVIAQW